MKRPWTTDPIFFETVHYCRVCSHALCAYPSSPCSRSDHSVCICNQSDIFFGPLTLTGIKNVRSISLRVHSDQHTQVVILPNAQFTIVHKYRVPAFRIKAHLACVTEVIPIKGSLHRYHFRVPLAESIPMEPLKTYGRYIYRLNFQHNTIFGFHVK